MYKIAVLLHKCIKGTQKDGFIQNNGAYYE